MSCSDDGMRSEHAGVFAAQLDLSWADLAEAACCGLLRLRSLAASTGQAQAKLTNAQITKTLMYFIDSTPNFQTRRRWLGSTYLRAALAVVGKHARFLGGGSNLLLALHYAEARCATTAGCSDRPGEWLSATDSMGMRDRGAVRSRCRRGSSLRLPRLGGIGSWRRWTKTEFNMSVRKFLKVVGVTSQREIEKAVHEAIQAGRLRGDERLQTKVTLTIEAVGLAHVIEDGIELG